MQTITATQFSFKPRYSEQRFSLKRSEKYWLRARADTELLRDESNDYVRAGRNGEIEILIELAATEEERESLPQARFDSRLAGAVAEIEEQLGQQELTDFANQES